MPIGVLSSYKIFRICKFLPTKLCFFKNKAALPIYLFEDSGILVGVHI